MLPLSLRALLVIGALFALGVVGRQVKKDKIMIEDAVFWVVLAAVLVFLALFPGIAITLAAQLGFMSASNFVYLAIIVLLLWKVFTNSAEISRLKAKINELAQEMALAHLQADDDSDNASDTRNR
ncbi:DUF2304 domain-containing protein [Enorma phocaeensis]|uniref:DUF2304 domain-containing protein n=1 Tax=Enorma phocaeensis TaxID=1871019 RepID=UPI0023543A47|nr:DUF2304 domain-containing protein [Enorma phocaeensis]